jgi:hypothetical protein
MKFNLKMIAAAAALVAASSSHAALTNASLGNSSFAMLAYNTVTSSYYVRDLGYLLNSFLPSSITTASGDGAVTGTMTPEAGANIVWATDDRFSTWISGMTLSDVKWTVAAGDAQATSGITNLSRALVAMSSAPAPAVTNLGVRNGVASAAGVSGLATQNSGMGGSATGSTVLASFLSNNSFGASTLTGLGNAASLYYYATTAGTGSNTGAANFTQFGNSLNFATLTLGTSGNLTYDLQPASVVPVPAAAWLMGSGLLGLIGAARRRKAAKA